MRTRRLLLTSASATTVVVVAAVTLFDLTHLSMGECLDQEAEGYPHLEQVAQEVVGSVGDRTRRVSHCEEAGEPGAYVKVAVYDWSTRKVARAHLREAGLVYQGVRVRYTTAVHRLENNGERYVTVSFDASS